MHNRQDVQQAEHYHPHPNIFIMLDTRPAGSVILACIPALCRALDGLPSLSWSQAIDKWLRAFMAHAEHACVIITKMLPRKIMTSNTWLYDIVI